MLTIATSALTLASTERVWSNSFESKGKKTYRVGSLKRLPRWQNSQTNVFFM
jgi:predicted metalloprotease